MKKLIDFGMSPWPMLIMTILGVVVALFTSLDWMYSQSDSDRIIEPSVEETQL
jgi:hypothetical protein